MKYSAFRVCIPVLILILMAVPYDTLYGQKPIKCHEAKKSPWAPDYKAGWTTYSDKGPKTLFLAISIDPRHFIRDDMIALARRISKDYCYERRLDVEIFDQHHAARKFFPTSEIEWFHRHWRGTYLLDRDAGSESISFSTSPDKPKDEVKINLNPRNHNQNKALTDSAKLLQKSDCQKGLAQAGINVTDLIKRFTDPQVQQFLQTERGKGAGGFIYGQDVMLRKAFFNAHGAARIGADISRGLALIHEAVHLTGKSDLFFGGSAKLNDVVIHACWSKLYGHNDLSIVGN